MQWLHCFSLRSFGILGNLVNTFQLHEHQLSPFAIYEEQSIDGFVRGLATQTVQAFDSSFSEEVNKTFEDVQMATVKYAGSYFI